MMKLHSLVEICLYQCLFYMRLLPGVLMSSTDQGLSLSLCHSTESAGDKQANKNVSILHSRPIKKMQALHSPGLTHAFSQESWKERRNKVNSGWWWLEIRPRLQKNNPEKQPGSCHPGQRNSVCPHPGETGTIVWWVRQYSF